MDELKEWMDSQLEERKVEPNSSLGEAIPGSGQFVDEFGLLATRLPGWIC